MVIDLIARLTLAAAPATVFALTLDAHRFPTLFRGFGPIPALTRISLHAAPAVGCSRTVESADGGRMTECITALEPGHRHAYSLSGFRPPLSWLVRAGHADWQFTANGDGTTVVWRYRFELTTPLVWPLAAPLLKIFMQGAMRRCLLAMAQALA
ncbi:MAG: SRPBCC family protein [Rhodanobacteraceae bacterium]|nr:SRPBCC family protein [Rhodanobacteraceae bacterium]MBK7043053.1 SRPBCC family protein [Rhodanobacteraceae bacterium]MBP9154690.1 SRPBCC family protein [Xanthomonadales bacterium]HQW81396.1 SRPBCC family protein [Pseudomonadota bacterium]